MKNEQPKIEELPERTVAFVSYTGNYMGNPQVFMELFGKICGWAGAK
ncbi:MAG: transcriptional regulator, partial [Candidatus Electrothrix sp. ATG2]|nr:transcriptional regulator [Candidatus Electrothrix sp. ATG2]